MEIVAKVWIACIPNNLKVEGDFILGRDFHKLRRIGDEQMVLVMFVNHVGDLVVAQNKTIPVAMDIVFLDNAVSFNRVDRSTLTIVKYHASLTTSMTILFSCTDGG